MTANWYCIRTATRQEQKVVEGIHDLAYERRFDLDVYLPCETRWNRLARVKTIKQVPMLPGYLFVNIEAEHLWRVERLDGVYQILGWASRQTNRQAERLAGFVTALRVAQERGAFDKTNKGRSPSRHSLKPGETVKITEGPFTGFVSQIAQLSGNDKVRMFLSIFGRATEVEVDARHLETQDAEPMEAA